jgi:hypothetical protein
MRTITFTEEDRKALAHDRYHHPDPRVQRKMEVLWAWLITERCIKN